MNLNVMLDASALRDLHQNGILASMEHAGLHVSTTTLAFRNAFLPQANAVPYSFIQQLQPDDQQYLQMQRLNRQYTSTLLIDCSVLIMAGHCDCTLITSDLTVRKIASETGIKVLPYFDLFGHMVYSGIVSLATATDCYYEIMRSSGRMTGFDPPEKLPAELWPATYKSSIA